ncbi:UDP-N-acetylmuramoylalanyl-D-glutamyl-2,6-diaminopimelate--D-alanyl-D-alanyl ligase [gut metagenome]|uniref:UDP-MurNAc-pentapeptide synthetase n=1 Tax=gut metagenome TaxID=749906 RepID=J9GQM6_9ZZZZ
MSLSELYQLYLEHPVVTTDTRDCPEGSLFFALRGANFDGNAFARQALQSGCAYAVVDAPCVREAVSASEASRYILVDDVLTTLQQLAAYHRRQLGIPVIQITGTNGKTTTKELTAAVLATKWHVLYTQGNFNNHIGVPKTLLRLNSAHQLAVIETGANHPGEIAELSALVDANCGLITNVGRAHLEGFGSFEGVIHTKGELYDYLRQKPGAFIFLDGDNPHLTPIAEGIPAVTYGLPGKGYDVEGEIVACNPWLQFRFCVKGGEWHTVQTHLIGSYNLTNALAALAVGLRFDVSPEQASQAIAAYVPSNNRSELLRTAHNELIVDAYNANPTSMRAALDNFALISHPHKMLILGEMRELGAVSAEEHQKVAAQALSLGAEAVWFVGEEFQPYSEGAQWFPDVEAVKTALSGGAKPAERLILIKGSNGTKLFQLPALL